MQLSVSVPKEWVPDTTYNIDIVFGSFYTYFSTQLNVSGPNFRFVAYQVIAPNGMVETFKTGATNGSQLKFTANYSGSPSVTDKWTIRVQARTNGSFGPDNLLTVTAASSGG